MSEGKRRSRKSKLEVRDDDCEYEVVNAINEETTTSHLQKTPRLVLKLEYPEIPASYDHDYCQRGSQSFSAPSRRSSAGGTAVQPTHSSGRPLEVQVLVEKLDETRVGQFNEKRPTLLRKMAYTAVTMERSNSRKRVRTPKIRIKNKNCIEILKCDMDMLYKVSGEIAESSNNLADRILDIEIRNLWGNVLITRNIVDEHEEKLQVSLEQWQAWYTAVKVVRDSPLFYQCHICSLAWWRLQPFREHIKIHDVKTLKVLLKENLHECMIISTTKDVNHLTFIDIEGDCWKCGRNLEFHKMTCDGYMCRRCHKSHYTCTALNIHESKCMYSNISNYNITQDRQCTICEQFMDTVGLVEKHMVLTHSVPSDVVVPTSYKHCSSCKFKYFTHNTHNCSKKPKNSACGYCCRKFATKPLVSAHMFSPYNGDYECRVCGDMMLKCQEMEHMLKEHSDNYKLAFKCTLCPEQTQLYVDLESVTVHRMLKHHKKTDNRRSFYEVMPVPKKCMNTYTVRQSSLSDVLRPDHDYVVQYDDGDDDDDECFGYSDEEDIISIPSVSGPLMLAADVDITVDEVDIKKEYNENGEIDYEEMLRNMFSESPRGTNDTATVEKNIVIEEVKDQNTGQSDEPVTKNNEFSFGSVKIKSEPADDIDIIEHPLPVQIKSEPMDDLENQTESMDQNEQIELENQKQSQDVETLTVKVEPDIDMDDIATGNVVIKNEMFEDDNNDMPSVAVNQLITDLNTNDECEEKVRPNGFSDVINPSGLYKKKRLFTCLKCGYTAQHKQYEVHVRSKCAVSPGNESHSCTKCGLTFVMFRNYVLHFDSHGYKPMSCPKCGELFDLQVKLLSHVQRHIKTNFVGIHVLNKGGEETTKTTKKVKCLECREVVLHADMFRHWEAHLVLKRYTQEPALVKEEPPELVVEGERGSLNERALDPAAMRVAIEQLTARACADKVCAVCRRAFSRRCDVKRHVVEHLLRDAYSHKERHRELRCQICAAGFASQERYKFHMREHGGMPIFKCELCNKTFSDSSNFAKHKKTHNVRVLVCDHCGKKFHSRPALQKHIAEHSSRVQYGCAACGLQCPSAAVLKRHRYRAHVRQKFRCKACDLAFLSLQHKWEHAWEVHRERKHQADCPICYRSFRKYQDVRQHARSEHRSALPRCARAARGKRGAQHKRGGGAGNSRTNNKNSHS